MKCLDVSAQFRGCEAWDSVELGIVRAPYVKLQ